MKDFIIPSDRDFGTPYVRSTATVTLNIDGFDVTVPEGTSIMRAAAEIGITVPKLCATDNLEAFGSCRLLRPPARLPDLLGQWRLRVAGHGGRGWPARCAL